MPIIFGVALGGAVGASGRYAVDRYIEARSDAIFPWATFIVNLTGCLLIGVVAAALVDRHHLPEWVRIGLVVGVARLHDVLDLRAGSSGSTWWTLATSQPLLPTRRQAWPPGWRRSTSAPGWVVRSSPPGRQGIGTEASAFPCGANSTRCVVLRSRHSEDRRSRAADTGFDPADLLHSPARQHAGGVVHLGDQHDLPLDAGLSNLEAFGPTPSSPSAWSSSRCRPESSPTPSAGVCPTCSAR